jgi:hypothetical protein
LGVRSVDIHGEQLGIPMTDRVDETLVVRRWIGTSVILEESEQIAAGSIDCVADLIVCR